VGKAEIMAANRQRTTASVYCLEENKDFCMGNHESERELIRQQWETTPYPELPLETSPKKDANSLYITW
jgi:hypothetical protein